MKTKTSLTLFDPVLVMPAIKASFTKLNPRVQWRNPVMFVVYIGSILTTLLGLQALQGKGETSVGFIFAVALWLWFTVLFANFAEALAEGRSKAQAASLRTLKKSTWAKKLTEPKHGARFAAGPPQGETAPSGGSAAREAASVGAIVSPPGRPKAKQPPRGAAQYAKRQAWGPCSCL
jgi:K+-transporting ATPase ATPase B chain